MAVNFKSSGSLTGNKQVFLDDSQLTNHRYYTFPNIDGTFVTTNSTNVIGTNQILNDAVTYAKIQNVTSQRLLGRASAGSGDTQEITLGSAFSFDGTTLNVSAGATVTNAGNNRLVTSDGTSTGLVAESNIQFDGNRLSVTGSVTASQFTGSRLAPEHPTFIGLASSASHARIIDAIGITANIVIPEWPQYVTVICIGGGGGGGGGSNNILATHFKSGGAGGGGGEIVVNTYRRSDLPAYNPATLVSAQVGARGTAGAVGGPGGNGGNTRFGDGGGSNWPKIEAKGGIGGAAGVAEGGNLAAPTVACMTLPTPGRPSNFHSLGAGGGGAGVYNDSSNPFVWGVSYAKGPDLPYTINDTIRQSYRASIAAAGNYPWQDLLLNGVPASVACGGGGGGQGADKNNALQGTTIQSGGSILARNTTAGGRTYAGAQNEYAAEGIIYENPFGINTPFLRWLRSLPIGNGGNGGMKTNNPSAGGDCGGGGGGGQYNTAGAQGGRGGILIILEG